VDNFFPAGAKFGSKIFFLLSTPKGELLKNFFVKHQEMLDVEIEMNIFARNWWQVSNEPSRRLEYMTMNNCSEKNFSKGFVLNCR
jgi:hypothetical protein